MRLNAPNALCTYIMSSKWHHIPLAGYKKIEENIQGVPLFLPDQFIQVTTVDQVIIMGHKSLPHLRPSCSFLAHRTICKYESEGENIDRNLHRKSRTKEKRGREWGNRLIIEMLFLSLIILSSTFELSLIVVTVSFNSLTRRESLQPTSSPAPSRPPDQTVRPFVAP